MIKKIAAAAVVAAASLSFVAIAHATDIPATPMNPGPAKITGMGPIGEIANIAFIPVNVIAQPVTSIGSPAAEPMAPAPMRRHHRHHHHM